MSGKGMGKIPDLPDNASETAVKATGGAAAVGGGAATASNPESSAAISEAASSGSPDGLVQTIIAYPEVGLFLGGLLVLLIFLLVGMRD